PATPELGCSGWSRRRVAQVLGLTEGDNAFGALGSDVLQAAVARIGHHDADLTALPGLLQPDQLCLRGLARRLIQARIDRLVVGLCVDDDVVLASHDLGVVPLPEPAPGLHQPRTRIGEVTPLDRRLAGVLSGDLT